MIVRTAFFEGSVKPGCEAGFEDILGNVLLPLWRQFPGNLGVQLLRPKAPDTDAPGYALVLATTYPDQATLDQALASDIREQTRIPTERLKSLFEGRVFHITFENQAATEAA
ncbi:Antibiotic biosynthesis monooxygenase [Ensifer adhaerens]|nr:Antibiotic biosynthesis monooxygenase [Ensifer adhaerens]